jgi:hypothetical protein
MNQRLTLTDTLQMLITDEFMKAIGVKSTHWSRPALHAIVKRGTRHFAQICTQLNTDLGTEGFRYAVRNLVPNFLAGCYHSGATTIPEDGPVLITSNHPGAADSLAVLFKVNREDVKIVITGVPYTEALYNAHKHFIYVKPDTQTRSQVIRDIIRHLRNGGAILIFPTGHVTPDPELTPVTTEVLTDWSPSVSIILRKVPETKLVMTVVSGVIEERFLNSPLCKIRKSKWRQQILAEFFQITWQMMHPLKSTVQPRVTYIKPVTGKYLLQLASQNDTPPSRQQLHNVILTHAETAIKKHLEAKNKFIHTPFT